MNLVGHVIKSCEAFMTSQKILILVYIWNLDGIVVKFVF